jgi:hypothetical protein
MNRTSSQCGRLLGLSIGIGCSILATFICAKTIADDDTGKYLPEEREHWSFQPRVEAALPTFDDEAYRVWVRTPIDAFVLRKQIENELRPAAETDRATLVRRLTFQMTGLPPSREEVSSFVSDTSPDAYERLVDRLLASPHYGEHWGQHWLDVVRYAETEGFEYDRYRPGAWRFRDYVIQSWNEDTPYDQFVREQIAGDELRPDDHDALAAAGFHRLGPVRRNAGNPEVAFSRNEVLTERIDAIGVAFMGMTVGCARCHDHMFDPIRQKDYYRLQGFLAAAFEENVSLASEEATKAWEKRKEEVAAEVKRIQGQLAKASGDEESRLRAELQAAQAREPKPLPTISTVRNNFDERTPIHLLERGDEFKKGERLTMRVLGVLLPDEAEGLPDDTPKPKSQLADWIADPENPLTARVIVNRLWQHHFGAGLVSTANDFGVNGDAPSHPELLDYLANRLIENGWRLKPIQRMILLSSTYRQSGEERVESGEYKVTAQEVDPENRLLWHFARRRLAAHEIRDAMLAVCGGLNRKTGGPSVMTPVDQELINLLYKPSQWVTTDARDHDRRSIYLIAKRNLRLPFMEVFDQPDFQTSCSRRESSTHAPQALEMLNGKLSNQLAEVFAERLRHEAGSDATAQIELAYRLTTGRSPTVKEHQLAIAFLAENPLREFALAMYNLNAFLYVE